MSIHVEPGPDGTVIVRGLSLDEVRAKLIRPRRGRPRKDDGTVLPAERIVEALASLRLHGMPYELPVDEAWVAEEAGVSRTTLRASVTAAGGSAEIIRLFRETGSAEWTA